MLSRMILILSNFVITWLVVIVALATAVLRVRSAMRRDKKKITMGFFHPYWCAIRPIIEQGQVLSLLEAYFLSDATVFSSRKIVPNTAYSNDGGGGERVLWRAIHAFLRANSTRRSLRCVVYSGDNATPQEIVDKAFNRFAIDLREYLESGELQFVFLKRRVWVEASSWPSFTMIGQSLGSMILGLEALWKYAPHIYVDSMGYAFTFPIFKYMGGCKIACYVHYPTISTDMLSKVASAEASFNNAADVASSPLKTKLKLLYYQAFAKIYALVGNRSDLIITNSSWTRGHIMTIWAQPESRVHLVFPACDTSRLQQLPLEGRKRLIISLAQFRPEKNHPLQLEAFRLMLQRYPELSDCKLAMVGGIRVGNDGDQRIVDSLRATIAADPVLTASAGVHVNVPNDDLKAMLGYAMVGLHTMSHEHFGIGIVEFMAAGVVPVAHNSGGPRQDIVVPFNDQATGYLAKTAEEYAERMADLLLNPTKTAQMQVAGRRSAQRFSDEAFSSSIIECFRKMPMLASEFSG